MPLPQSIAVILAALLLQDVPRERPDPPKKPGARQAPAQPAKPKRKTPAEILREESAARDALEAAASEKLVEVEQGLADVWLSRLASTARRIGLPPQDLEPIELGTARRMEWQAALYDAGGDLDAVPWADLGQARRKDHARLVALLTAERTQTQVRPRERWEPAFYLAEINRVLLAVSVAPELSPNHRLQAVTSHLRRLPELLASAQADLAPPARAAVHAMPHLEELELLLDTELTQRMKPGEPNPELWALFQDAKKPALAQTREMRAFLEHEAEEGGRMRRLGPRRWSELLTFVTGAELDDLASLKVTLMRDIGKIGQIIGPEQTPAPKQELTDETLAKGGAATLRAGWTVAHLLGLVQGEAPKTPMSVATDTGPRGEPIELGWHRAPSGAARAHLTVWEAGHGWSDAVSETRARELSTPALRAALLRYGYPGELLWETWSRNSEFPAHRIVWNEVLRGAWGLYAAEVCTRYRPSENVLSRDAQLRREVARSRRIEAARLFATLLIHAENATEAEAARQFAGLTGLPREIAEAEVLESLINPRHGAAYLGYLELRRLEGNVAPVAESEEAPSFVGRIVRHAPSAPPGLNVTEIDRLEDIGTKEGSGEASEAEEDGETEESEDSLNEGGGD